jgi:hypothetical protein
VASTGEGQRKRTERTTDTFDASDDERSHLEGHAKEPIIPVIRLEDPRSDQRMILSREPHGLYQ